MTPSSRIASAIAAAAGVLSRALCGLSGCCGRELPELDLPRPAERSILGFFAAPAPEDLDDLPPPAPTLVTSMGFEIWIVPEDAQLLERYVFVD